MTGKAPATYPTSAFDYALPPERIARYPAAGRDESRLLALDRGTGAIRHMMFRDVGELFAPGDVLVLNETRVLPARLLGERPGGGRAEVLLVEPIEPAEAADAGGDADLPRVWRALVRPGARLRAGARIRVADELVVEVEAVEPGGARRVVLRSPLAVREALERFGHVPLPPYIDRPDEPLDRDRYQTVYARAEGSVAAPTAGLHFTERLLERIATRGVTIARIVLHVGPGTFRPVTEEDPARHTLQAERFEVSGTAAAAVHEARARGGRVWAVGSTVTRALETAGRPDGTVEPCAGQTALFIRPPYTFRVVGGLITNFHLPRSTLLMLVAAFGGYDAVMRAYREAVAEGYRFYSYGDAMVVF